MRYFLITNDYDSQSLQELNKTGTLCRIECRILQKSTMQIYRLSFWFYDLILVLVTCASSLVKEVDIFIMFLQFLPVTYDGSFFDLSSLEITFYAISLSFYGNMHFWAILFLPIAFWAVIHLTNELRLVLRK